MGTLPVRKYGLKYGMLMHYEDFHNLVNFGHKVCSFVILAIKTNS